MRKLSYQNGVKMGDYSDAVHSIANLEGSRSPTYPLPVDPKTLLAWWEINALLVVFDDWRRWQADKEMASLIPVLNWLVHGAMPS